MIIHYAFIKTAPQKTIITPNNQVIACKARYLDAVSIGIPVAIDYIATEGLLRIQSLQVQPPRVSSSPDLWKKRPRNRRHSASHDRFAEKTVAITLPFCYSLQGFELMTTGHVGALSSISRFSHMQTTVPHAYRVASVSKLTVPFGVN